MKRTWTIIGVRDVSSSLKWYQSLFGQPTTLPAHDYFGQIVDSDGHLGLGVRIHVWLLFEPTNERTCPLKRWFENH